MLQGKLVFAPPDIGIIVTTEKGKVTVEFEDAELARRAGCKAGIRIGELGGTGDWVAASFSDAVHRVVQQTKEFQNC